VGVAQSLPKLWLEGQDRNACVFADPLWILCTCSEAIAMGKDLRALHFDHFYVGSHALRVQ